MRASTQRASKATSAAASSWRVSRDTRLRRVFDVDMVRASTQFNVRRPRCSGPRQSLLVWHSSVEETVELTSVVSALTPDHETRYTHESGPARA